MSIALIVVLGATKPMPLALIVFLFAACLVGAWMVGARGGFGDPPPRPPTSPFVFRPTNPTPSQPAPKPKKAKAQKFFFARNDAAFVAGPQPDPTIGMCFYTTQDKAICDCEECIARRNQ